MRVLFDHGTPAPLLSFLRGHTVRKTQELGWDTLNNGELLNAAEEAAFEVFLTTDKNIRYQQNLAERPSRLWSWEIRGGRSCNATSIASWRPSMARSPGPIPKWKSLGNKFSSCHRGTGLHVPRQSFAGRSYWSLEPPPNASSTQNFVAAIFPRALACQWTAVAAYLSMEYLKRLPRHGATISNETGSELGQEFRGDSDSAFRQR